MHDGTLEGTATPLFPELERIFPGDSEMARRMRAFDWSRHELGAPTAWPQSLKTAIRIILTSRQPMFAWWGSRLVNLYNDAYIPVLGGKHPAALGTYAPDIWHEIWHVVGPRAEQALSRDEGTYDEALLLLMERNGYVEETYFTFSYSPIVDEEGGYGGIFSPVTEDTQRIIGERQLALLRELSVRTADARTWQDACTLSAAALATNPHDIYWALIYMIDADKNAAVLAAATGVKPGSRAAPLVVPLDESEFETAGCPWPLAAVAGARRPILIDDLASLPPVIATGLPAGVRGFPAARAIAVPISPSGVMGKTGILVVGLSPLRLWDDTYQRFLDLVTGEIAAALANGQAYAEERRRAEALAELDRAKTTFFSNVSHEFRTPLSLMLGPLDDLLRDGLPPAAHQQVDMIHRNALRLLRLVNTLLDFARIEAARMEAAYEPVDLAALTTDLAATFRSAIERAGMQLIVDCPPLPEPVYVDREMWEKIVLNLLSNAFKFTFAGEIVVSLRWCDDHVELAVRDTGTGIPATELPHVFDRFHRAPGARGRTIEGTGIGLALVKELVRLHGGIIEAASVVDQGSVFTVSLPTGCEHLPAGCIGTARSQASAALGAMPFVEEALRWLPDGASGTPGVTSGDGASGTTTPAAGSTFDLETAQALGHPPAAGSAPQLGSARILVADDNADMRLYLRQLLGTRWQIETVADGAAALDAAAARPPDLILADVMMPGLDGFALLAQLRSDPRWREIPVILLSARAGDEARIEGMESGADDYLVKPFSSRELVARIQAHLELSRVRRESAAALRELSQSLEVRVQERTLELARSNQELDQFAYVASHDLKAPLRAIDHLASWISQDAAHTLPTASQEHLQKLRSRIRRMERLLDDLLAYSRAGRHLHEPEWVDTETLVRDVGFMLAPPPGFVLEVQGPLPQLYTERVPLETVLRNLIGNAVKHHDHPEDGWVRISVEDQGDWVEFTVVDNGPGIEPQHRERVFQVFQTLKPRDQVEGSGIGLAVVKKTVENQGGQVSLIPHPGRGATFCFTWPKRSP